MFFYIVLGMIGLLVVAFIAGADWFVDASIRRKHSLQDRLNGRKPTEVDLVLEQYADKQRKIALNVLAATLLVAPIYALIGYTLEPASTGMDKETVYKTVDMTKQTVSPTQEVITKQLQPVCSVTFKQTYPLGMLPQFDQTLVFDGKKCSQLSKREEQAIDTMLDALNYNIYVDAMPDQLKKQAAKVQGQYGGEAPSQEQDEEE